MIKFSDFLPCEDIQVQVFFMGFLIKNKVCCHMRIRALSYRRSWIWHYNPRNHVIAKNPELRNPLPETKCDKSIHYLSLSTGLSSIKNCNISQGVTHPVTRTPGIRHHPVIYWLPGRGFSATKTNCSSECKREAISLLGPGISVC